MTRAPIGSGIRGLVYVLCFTRPYISPVPIRWTATWSWADRRLVVAPRWGRVIVARHYIGWTRDRRSLAYRLAHHRAGRGARLLAAVAKAGIDWHVVAVFLRADRHFERMLHSRRDTKLWCPCCAHTARHVKRFRSRHGLTLTRKVPVPTWHATA